MQTLDMTPATAAAAMEAARATAARALADAAGLELFGSFHLGGEEFALPALALREVVAYPERVTRMPLSPACLEGIFTLRGTAIPIVNLARVFDPQAPGACGSKMRARLTIGMAVPRSVKMPSRQAGDSGMRVTRSG